jgi:hypothetical protein
MLHVRDRYGSRALIGVSLILAALLVVMAVMQYRWATRMADDEAQLAKKHLVEGASVFCEQFDLLLTKVHSYIESINQETIASHTPLTKLGFVRDFFYLESTEILG